MTWFLLGLHAYLASVLAVAATVFLLTRGEV